MALNPYFLNGTRSEQGLVQDLTNELIQMAGHDVIYMPRKYITDQSMIRELLVSKFDTGFTIEAYVSTYDGFGGQGDILSKFGVRSTDEVTFIISKERYDVMMNPLLKGQSNVKVANRPQEGDLIYFPVDNGLFEVKYVEFKRPFYQLNKLYVYELRCELFEYEDELIDTGIDAVDETVKKFGYIQTLKMVPDDATNASLSATPLSQVDKSVYYIDVINGGYGYKSTPTVKIDKAPSGGINATAVASLKTIGNESTVNKILIINPGLGYTVSPNVSIVSNSGKGFIGTARIATGVLGPVSIANSGFGYTSAPPVSISTSITGDDASAISVLSTNTTIAQVRYLNAGYGYTSSPTIDVVSPVGVSTGTYRFNEMIVGSASSTTAYVKEWDAISRILKVSIVDGDFIPGESILGENASFNILSVETDDLYEPFSQNTEIEDEAISVIDFTESNPFGNF